MQHITRLTDRYVRATATTTGDLSAAAAALRADAAHRVASTWGIPLQVLTGPSVLNAAYRQRQRNRCKRR